MAELVDVQDLGSCGAVRVGSSPTARTKGGGFEEGLPSFSYMTTYCIEEQGPQTYDSGMSPVKKEKIVCFIENA